MTSNTYTQTRHLPLLATPAHCAGKSYIVTGANTGLGLEAAKHLAALGAARVVLAVRNLAAGEAARVKVEEAADNAGAANAGGAASHGGAGAKKAQVEVWPLDLCSYDSVRRFAARVAAELPGVDGLVLNAGVALSHREMAEGHVVPVTVNVLSTLLLAALVLPVMSRRAKEAGRVEGDKREAPTIVVVTSVAGFDVRDAWEEIKGDPIAGMDAEGMEAFKTYPLTKLTETVAVRHLARELVPFDKTGVVVNLVCPGLCVTDLGRNSPPEFMVGLRRLYDAVGRTAEDGSRTLLHAVVAGPESHGRLLHSCADGEHDVPDWVKDDLEGQKNTWEIIAKELEVAQPGCVRKMLQCV